MKKKKRSLITFTLLLLLSCVLSVNGYPVHAEEIIAKGGTDTLTWQIDASGCLTITGQGDYPTTINGYPLWFNFSDQITSVDINVTDMQSTAYMFCGCYNLKELDLSMLDTSKVTDMRLMFASCAGLRKLNLGDKFDTSNVEFMNGMFAGCVDLTELDLSMFDTSKVTNMFDMFGACYGLTELDLSMFDTSNVQNMAEMFYGCYNLEELNFGDTLDTKFDTSNVTNMGKMFDGCSGLTELDLNVFDTSKVTNMMGMFNLCSGLERLNLGDTFATGNVESMEGMFAGCSGLTGLDLSTFDTSKVTNMNYMFMGCSGLTELNLSMFNTSGYPYMYDMFDECSSLNSIISPQFLAYDMKLPSVANYIWKDSAGTIVTSIPAESDSTTYTRYYRYPATGELFPPGQEPNEDDEQDSIEQDRDTDDDDFEQPDNDKPYPPQTGVTDNQPTSTPPATEPQLPVVGTQKTISSGTYKITASSSESKTVTFVKPKSSKKTSLTIPATINIDGQTYQVTEVAAKAFKNNKKIKSVTIGKNVKKVGKEAFSGCSKLNKIAIKSTALKSVGKNAIKGIDGKATIKCPKKQLEKYKKLFKGSTGYKKTMKIKK